MSEEVQQNEAATRRKAQRKTWFIRLGAGVAVAGVAWLAYWVLIGSHHVETEDAYVGADTAQVTALISGAVISRPVIETQVVRKGQVLAVIDPADYRLAADRAHADLDQTRRKVEGYFANDLALEAQANARTADVRKADAQLVAANADFTRAAQEFARRRKIAGTGAVSGDELTDAENRFLSAQAGVAQAQAGVAQARAAVAAAEQQRKVAAALVAGSGVQGNPEVAMARSRSAQADLDLQRTVIRAPVDGVVTRNAIQVGQRVQPGTTLMSVVPVQTAYVDANFKEVQLRKIHVGSPATLTSDVYGGGVKYHGKVVGVAGGSGSAFALIPAQNATGNWIKVVQRVPVRIALDPKELAEHPLRVGVSMKVVVDSAAPRT